MSVCRAAYADRKNDYRTTNCKLCGRKISWPTERAKWRVLWPQLERGTGRMQVKNVAVWYMWLSKLLSRTHGRSLSRLPSRSSVTFLNKLLSRLPRSLPNRLSGRFLAWSLSRLPSSLLSSLPSRLLCRLTSGCSVDYLIDRPVDFLVGCLLGHLPFSLLSSLPSTLLSSMFRVQHEQYFLLTGMFRFQSDTLAEAGCTHCF
jgi:hypothetical protein